MFPCYQEYEGYNQTMSLLGNLILYNCIVFQHKYIWYATSFQIFYNFPLYQLNKFRDSCILHTSFFLKYALFQFYANANHHTQFPIIYLN